MISLDTRLEGEQLCLRPSMTKFSGSPDSNIEICSSARRPLPMKLNRQIIKILEDLGVTLAPFLQLQREAVESLRITTENAVNACNFLDRMHVGMNAQSPWLIKRLHYMGLDFIQDEFLRNLLELAVLSELRDIKHRSRILVEDGYTLIGRLNPSYLKFYTDLFRYHGRDGLFGRRRNLLYGSDR